MPLPIHLWSSLASAAEPDACPPPEGALTSAATSLASLQIATATVDLGQFVTSAQCAERVTPSAVAHYFQAEAFRNFLNQNDADTDASLAAARAIAPEDWFSDLGLPGSEFHARWAATAPQSGRAARLKFDDPGNLARGEWVAVDGAVVDAPYDLVPGLHLVQVGKPDGRSRYARVFGVEPGQGINLDLPPASVAAVDWQQAVLTQTTRLTPAQRRRQRLVAGAITGATAAALYGGAVIAYEAGYQGGGASDAMRNTVNGLTAASAVTAAGAGVLLVVGFGTGTGGDPSGAE